MAKITRYLGNLKAFASAATALNRTLFADAPNQSDTLTDNINADALIGWEKGLDPVNGLPPQEYFNALGFIATQLSAYLHQAGIAEWDNAQEYYIGGFTNVAGVIYKSLVDANINFNPTSEPTKWSQIDAGTLGGQAAAHYLARANHTGTQDLATITGHDKAAHDSLLINAAELGGSAAALFALLVSPAFTGNPTAPTQAPNDNSTKIATTAYADAAISGIGSVKAWVNFDASSGTPTIQASGNVASVTDTAVGDFTVNFSVALADANYAVQITTNVQVIPLIITQLAASVRVQTPGNDPATFCVTCVR